MISIIPYAEAKFMSNDKQANQALAKSPIHKATTEVTGKTVKVKSEINNAGNIVVNISQQEKWDVS